VARIPARRLRPGLGRPGPVTTRSESGLEFGLEFRFQAGQPVRAFLFPTRLRDMEPAAPEDFQTRLKAELRTKTLRPA
jgi:hypothetical protein